MKVQNNTVYMIFFYFALCVCWSTQDKVNIGIPAPLVVEFQKQAQICEKETGVPATHTKKIVDCNLPDDTPNRKFLNCTGFNTGYSDAAGHFIADKFLMLEIAGGVDKYKNVIEECNKINEQDPLDTLFSVVQCFCATFSFTRLGPK